MDFSFYVVREPSQDSLIVAQSDNGKHLIAVRGKIHLQKGEYEASDFFIGNQWKILYDNLKKLKPKVLAELIHSADACRLFHTTSAGFEPLSLHLLKKLDLEILEKDSIRTVYRKHTRKRRRKDTDSPPSLF